MTFKTVIPYILGATLVAAAYWASIYDYLLFHTLAETIPNLVSLAIVIIVVHTHRYQDRPFIIILGIVFGCAVIFDILHTLTYYGLDILIAAPRNMATELWVVGRYLDAIGMLLACLSLRLPVRPAYVFGWYLAATALALLSLFYWNNFPDCYIDGIGLTPFKIASEYIICSILLTGNVLLYRHRGAFKPRIYSFLSRFFLFNIAAELMMTTYLDVYGFSNMVGHIFRVMSYYYLYRATVASSLREPYEKLTVEMNRREELHRLFTLSYQNSPVGICFIRLPELTFYDVNPVFERSTGYLRSHFLGRSLHDLSLDATGFIRRAANELITGGTSQGEIICRTITGDSRSLLATVTKLRINDSPFLLLMGIDITDKLRLEAQIEHLDRLNLIGEMAAGIGHEVRNPMTTVRGYLQLFQRRPAFASHGEQLATMIDEIDRANSIITEFLSLAKNKPTQQTPGNLNTVVGQLFPLIQADAFRLGHEAHMTLGDLPDSVFDGQEIRQLILNLGRNGLEAMAPGGHLTITTACDDASITLAVKDNGPGIPPSVLDQLGKPFVTTKETGTGLGLPICYRIAERHGAELKVDTSPTGTTFSLILPRQISAAPAFYQQQELFPQTVN
mgnify:FL=1